MPAGLAVTKETLNARAGSVALQARSLFEQTAAVKEWLDATPNADMEAMGFSAGEVAVIKSAFADLDQLRTIWQGTANLPASKDFRQWTRQLWGLG